MSDSPCVVLIERQDFWRTRCASALESRGYSVVQLATYDVEGRMPAPEAADLVVLGCTTVGPAEVRLIGEIRRRREPVLLVCTVPEARGTRAGFCAGAADVVERSYQAAEMVATVDRTLAAPPARHPAPAGELCP